MWNQIEFCVIILIKKFKKEIEVYEKIIVCNDVSSYGKWICRDDYFAEE